MRILMLNNEFPPLGGGMGTTNDALLRKFAALPDMEIDLITAALGKRHEQVQVAERIRFFKVPVNNRNLHHSSNRELITYSIQALPMASRLHQLHAYDFCFAWSALPAGVVARGLEARFGLPYMVWVSGPDIPGFEQRYRALYPFLMPLLKATWRHAKPLIAKCAQEIEMIHASDPDLPVALIPNGVDIEAFRPGESIPDKGPLRVLCVARLIERKGQHHLIQAIKRLKDETVHVTLDLVGTGDSLKSLQALTRELGVEWEVNFVSYVPREAISRHYASAHVFALPSYNEGMALAALEAMAAGLPLVVTRTGGTEELVEEGCNGLVFNWADVPTLTAHLRTLANNRTLARQMGLASRRRAEKYSWDNIAQVYVQLFHDFLERRSHSPSPKLVLQRDSA